MRVIRYAGMELVGAADPLAVVCSRGPGTGLVPLKLHAAGIDANESWSRALALVAQMRSANGARGSPEWAAYREAYDGIWADYETPSKRGYAGDDGSRSAVFSAHLRMLLLRVSKAFVRAADAPPVLLAAVLEAAAKFEVTPATGAGRNDKRTPRHPQWK